MSFKFYVIRNQSGVVCFRFFNENDRNDYFDKSIDKSSRMWEDEEDIEVMGNEEPIRIVKYHEPEPLDENNTITGDITKLKLFLSGFIQVFFVAINTYLIAKTLYMYVFYCSVLISLTWSYNVKKVAFGTFADRMYYALGAGFGSAIGLAITSYVYKHFLT